MKENIYFTSDTHFSHGNIIKYSLRPFLPDEGWELYFAAKEDLDKRQKEKCFDYKIMPPTQAEREWKHYRLPKKNVDEHDDALIENWNKMIKPHDRVYHLGDFCFCNPRDAHQILDRLNGQIFLILGNHDKTAKQVSGRFIWIKDLFGLKVDDSDTERGRQEIVLCHYSMRVWNKSHHGAWHCFGHSHGSLPDYNKSFDIGVDAVAKRLAIQDGRDPELDTHFEDYRPLTYEEIKCIMSEKEWKPVDHHM